MSGPLSRMSVVLGALAAAVLCAVPANAAVLTYTEVVNPNATTKSTTTYNPLNIVSTNSGSVYGSNTISPVGSGWQIVYSPTAAFNATATGSLANGGMSQETHGKLEFTLTFDVPVNLTAKISEGGTFFKSGPTSFVEAIVGAVVVEAINVVPVEIGTNNILKTFNNSNGTWQITDDIGGFVGSYTQYKFTIDNDLFADAFVDSEFTTSLATINKTFFVIDINPDGGGAVPVPLPASVWGGLALGGAALAFAKRRRRSA